jgi:hypothetical protein
MGNSVVSLENPHNCMKIKLFFGQGVEVEVEGLDPDGNASAAVCT